MHCVFPLFTVQLKYLFVRPIIHLSKSGDFDVYRLIPTQYNGAVLDSHSARVRLKIPIVADRLFLWQPVINVDYTGYVGYRAPYLQRKWSCRNNRVDAVDVILLTSTQIAQLSWSAWDRQCGVNIDCDPTNWTADDAADNEWCSWRGLMRTTVRRSTQNMPLSWPISPNEQLTMTLATSGLTGQFMTACRCNIGLDTPCRKKYTINSWRQLYQRLTDFQNSFIAEKELNFQYNSRNNSSTR